MKFLSMMAACLLFACTSKLDNSNIKPVAQATECRIEQPDADGYLKTICEYLVEKKVDVSPGRVDTYGIRQLVRSKEAERDVINVYLNCCYLGDLAVIDSKTKQVIRFSVGPK
jgi:hypothetical protein